MEMRNAVIIAMLATLAACGGRTGESADANVPAPAGAKALRDIAPAIIPPGEVADPTEPPSYEVAIASAAATRNRALELCHTQPEAVRTRCQQEANAAFAEATSDLQNLRANQE